MASWPHAGYSELGVRQTLMEEKDDRRMIDGRVKLYVSDRLTSRFDLGPRAVRMGHGDHLGSLSC